LIISFDTDFIGKRYTVRHYFLRHVFGEFNCSSDTIELHPIKYLVKLRLLGKLSAPSPPLISPERKSAGADGSRE
jgi:hypothetical protein